MGKYIEEILTKDGAKQINYDALANRPVQRIVSENTEELGILRYLESGVYVLSGRFRPYAGATTVALFTNDMLVNIVRQVDKSGVQVFSPANNAVQHMEITDDSYTMKSLYLNEVESTKVDATLTKAGQAADAAIVGTTLATKADGHEFDKDEGKLYLTCNGERLEGTGVSVAGGGGGGGGVDNNAVISISNETGWLFKTMAHGSPCPISFKWSSLEEGLETGPGVLKITVNSSVKATMEIQQGEQTVDIWPWLDVGLCSVKINVTDTYGNSRTLNFNITTVALSIESSFDSTTAYTGDISFTYTPVGYADKTVHFIVDGVEIGTADVSVSNRQQSFTIPAQSHGSHTFEVYFDATIDGNLIPSNRLKYSIICLEDGNTTPVIAISYWGTAEEQLALLNIPYVVYDPNSMTAKITQTANGREVGNLTVDRTQHIWSYRPDNSGPLELAIKCGDTEEKIQLDIIPNSIQVEAETEALALYLNAYGRSNNEDNPGTWTSGSVESSLTGFNYVSDGWQLDEDGATVLRVAGDARVEIPYKMMQEDSRTTGKTIEIEFSTRDVSNYDTPIITCFSGGRGLNITAQKASLTSEQSSVGTQFKENEHVRLSFVIEKSTNHRLLMCYINGIISGAVQYPADDDFSQLNPVGISIGSNECTVDIYCIRIYDNDLTRYQILDNWIADTPTLSQKAERYQRNNIYDDYGKIVISKLPEDLPYMVLKAAKLPETKGNKVTVGGSYTDMVSTGKSFTFEGAQADVQGTSSAGYARKNYKIKFKGGFIQGGIPADDYSLGGNIPTNTFTFKADVASSEGANNVELVKLYCDICPYQTPPQLLDKRVRQGIDGYPMVIFHDNGESVTFVGKYNFNHDKGTPEVFGLDDNDESWETKNNTSARVLWKSADFSAGSDWDKDYEARHPEDNTDTTKLAALAAWIVSTDTEQATGNILPEAVTYGDVEYTADTAEYRLAKFSAELGNWFDETSTIFYYLFTEIFLMTDSRAKNSFPTLYDNGKWCWLPYDMDTAIGIDNMGALTFGYELEDIDLLDGAPIYNGQDSVLWKNIRATRYDKIMEMYQTLRSDGLLSYDDVNRRFEEHQAKWPEAIFNEDAYYKYLQPLFDDGSGAYLSMLQGSKAEQRKWWLYNRFQYLDSKYLAGDSQKTSNTITLRGYNKSNITITPYADIYANVKFGSYLLSKRALRKDGEQTFVYPMDVAKETETYIYSATQIADIGDLSGYHVGYADFAAGIRLQSIKLGDAAEGYRNQQLTELYLGNNELLRTLDVRNCPNLGLGDQKSVDISGCANIEEVYFSGTSIAGVTLPNGGVLKKLHLPETIANLTIRNQPMISEFVLPSYANITTLRIENVSGIVPTRDILNGLPDGSRVRIIGFEWKFEDSTDILSLYDTLDKMRGIDENGGNVAKAQLSGTVYVPTLTEQQLDEMRQRYPTIDVRYDGIRKYVVRFYNGDTLLQVRVDVAYGASQVNFTGNTATLQMSGVDDPENYEFVAWYPAPVNIHSDINCMAVFRDKRNVALSILARTISGEYTNARVTKIRPNAFSNCPNLTGVSFPNATEVGRGAFSNCTALKSVDIPNAKTIGDNAMLNTAIETFVANEVTAVCDNAFAGTKSAKQIRVPNASVEDTYAFYNSGAELIEVKRVYGMHAFTNCSKLTALIIRDDGKLVPYWNNIFDGTPIADGTGYIYVEKVFVDNFKANSFWSKYSNQIRAIEDYPEIAGG